VAASIATEVPSEALVAASLAVNWAADHANAILQAWYPGDEDGTAVADVLFGDYNPAGRPPVTFYKSLNQLPPFESYSMDGRTYGTSRASRSTRSASASVTPSSHTRSSSCQRQWPPAPRLS